MAKPVRVLKAAKEQGTCGRCGVVIAKGDPYVHWSYRSGGRSVRCAKVECAPRQSELTQSKASAAYAAMEGAQDSLVELQNKVELEPSAFVEELESIRDVFVTDVEAAVSEYEEAADNIEEGFQHETEQSEEFREKAGELEEWKSDAENLDFDELEEGDDKDGWRDEQIQKLESVVEDCPV